MPPQLLLFPAVRPFAERFGVAFFREVPEVPGVYLMCGAGDGVLYVGKARNLRQRLGQYRSASTEVGGRRLHRLLRAVTRIHWDECADEAAAVARERELLVRLKPRFNVAGVRPASACWIGWRWEGGNGTAWPAWLELGWAGAAGEWPEELGPLTGMRPVLAAIRRLLWWAFTPLPSWSNLPPVLRGHRVPPSWRLALSPDTPLSPAELTRCLAACEAGDAAPLLALVGAGEPAGPLFEQRWRERDVDTVLEFAVVRARRAMFPRATAGPHQLF